MNARSLAALSALAAAGMIGIGISTRGSDLMDEHDEFLAANGLVRRVVFGEPRRATFTSERPLTKRQRRRLRGKAKP